MKTLSIYVFAIGLFLLGGNATTSLINPPTQDVLALHGYPYGKTAYASKAEWPRLSAQGHWSAPGNNPMGMNPAHLHTECTAPIYAELPHAPFTLDCQVQLFHVKGGIWGGTYGVFAWMSTVVWDSPEPVIGDPMGLVIRTFTVHVDPSVPFPNGSGGPPLFVPENGWFHVVVTAFVQFDDGTGLSTELRLPFYAKGNPAIPESHEFRDLAGFDYQLSARANAVTNGLNQHGTATSEYNDAMVPILAPIHTKIAVPAFTTAYARHNEDWPTPSLDRFKQMVDMDLHNGVPGRLVQEIGTDFGQVASDVWFDPATLGPGAHKVALLWDQQTGPVGKPPIFPPGEELTSLLVVTVTVADGATPPPVNCQGTWSYTPVSQSPTQIVVTATFTITQPPANGGAACPTTPGG